MVQKSSPSAILAQAQKRYAEKENPTHIEEKLIASLLQELDKTKDTRIVFDSFYKEIVKPLSFVVIRNKVLWWACNYLYNMDAFPRIDCKALKTFFSTPDIDLKVDGFTGLHIAHASRIQDSRVTSQVMSEYVDYLCEMDVEYSASEYLNMWRAASADKQRATRIKQIQVQYERTGNIDDFFAQMSDIEREYRKTINPNKAQESKGLADLDVHEVAKIISSTRPDEHFIPTADEELNRAVFGYPRGKAISLVTAVSGGGKSMHILRDAYHAFKQGYKVLYLSLELSEQRILRELMNVCMGIPSSVISGITTDEEMLHYTQVMLDKAKADAKKHKGAFYYDICEDLEVGDILDIIEVHLATLEVDAVYIDLFDEIPMSAEAGNTNPNLKGGFFEKMISGFINMGRTYDAAFIGAVQLKADAILNGKVQQEAIGNSNWYAKKASLILYCHRSSEDYFLDGQPISAYGREVLKDRESGFGRKGFQYVRFMDRDTKETYPAIQPNGSPFKTMQQLEREIKKQQKELESEF